jgi:hypothetical protein
MKQLKKEKEPGAEAEKMFPGISEISLNTSENFSNVFERKIDVFKKTGNMFEEIINVFKGMTNMFEGKINVLIIFKNQVLKTVQYCNSVNNN